MTLARRSPPPGSLTLYPRVAELVHRHCVNASAYVVFVPPTLHVAVRRRAVSCVVSIFALWTTPAFGRELRSELF